VCLLIVLMFVSAIPMRSQGKAQTIVFSVTDKKGQPVTDLKPTDVKAREDGKEQAVAAVRNITESPLSVVFLVDAGAGRATVPTYWQTDAADFFTSALRPGKDKGAVFHFRSNLSNTQDFTGEATALAAALKRNEISGSSALYNALVMTAASLEKTETRRAIVLVSDGDDRGSRTTAEEALAKLRETNTVVFPIIVKSDRVLPPDSADDFVRRLAEQTGGTMYTITGSKEAQKVFAEIKELLGAQFQLQYQPAAADGKFHKVRIEVADKNLKIKQPSGYYARP
jgi:VWFA-related protein